MAKPSLPMDYDAILRQFVWVLAILGGASVLGGQIASIRVTDRTVQVRGAAEIIVRADIATWTLGVTGTSDDLNAAQAQVNAGVGRIRAYLAKYGVAESEMENQNVTVTDAKANQYNTVIGPRFSVQGGVVVRTANLEAARQAKNALGELVSAGVVLTNSWGPNYAFTKLNDYKPQLLSAATAEARKAAEQFAKDSGAKVGGIIRARQGSVEVLGRDAFAGESEQVDKVLRLVTTVEYQIR